MDNTKIISEYILSGCNRFQRIGLELEHFVCNDSYEIITYEIMEECLNEICKRTKGRAYEENGNIFGVILDNYTITIEPGCQLEISIEPVENLEDIMPIYLSFRSICDEVFGNRGYFLLEKGVYPLIENGEMPVENIPMIPKERYRIMNEYFSHTGKYGNYMMRATASTQISVDFCSEKDAMKKMRVLEKISPILALITENRNNVGLSKEWNKHLLRTQIWNDVDKARCGYFPGSISDTYSFYEYADYLYTNPCILLQNEYQTIDLKTMSAENYYAERQIEKMESVESLISMYFPTVRLKKYIELRVADSMPIEKAISYAAFIKLLVYQSEVLNLIDKRLVTVVDYSQIYEAEKEISQNGYAAIVYGKTVLSWIDFLFELVLSVADKKEKKLVNTLITLPLLNYKYKQLIIGKEETHIESAREIKKYLLNSTANYHDRVVKTLYIPKLFTEWELAQFESAIKTLYGIFDKVIAEFESDEKYRKLFEFSQELNELILRKSRYNCNIPMARIDVFYDEETGDFKFCEFNTDGASAMNEDRELNLAFSKSVAYKNFQKTHFMYSLELFDSWVDEALKLYHGMDENTERKPFVAIVDFMENATINEFVIFKDRFEEKGCEVEICDIRELKWTGDTCVTPKGSKVDLIYRRAVTSDIMSHYLELSDFIMAVKNEAVVLIGDFRTQIVHNKILFKILHMNETMRLLSKQEQLFIKAHVPFTASLDYALLNEKNQLFSEVLSCKNKWILKPEDSYGSKGVYAGVELEDEEKWKELVYQCMDNHYILQEFVEPYRLENIDLLQDKPTWVSTSNLTGLFVYNNKFSGIYSRISFDKMISTQYNEMSIPTVIVKYS